MTINLIREAFASIVQQHSAGIAFYSLLTPAKDDGDLSYPACLWHRWTVNEAPDGAGETRGTFTISVSFVEAHATSRTRDEASYALERMEVLARQCWAKFYNTYVKEPGTYQGEDLDLEVEGSVTFLPFVDDGPHNLAGVGVEVTLRDNTAIACPDSFFG